MSFHRFELNQFQAVHFNRIFFILQTSFLSEKVCVIIMHLKQSSQKLIIILVYKQNKLPAVKLDLIITGSRA